MPLSALCGANGPVCQVHMLTVDVFYVDALLLFSGLCPTLPCDLRQRARGTPVRPSRVHLSERACGRVTHMVHPGGRVLLSQPRPGVT